MTELQAFRRTMSRGGGPGLFYAEFVPSVLERFCLFEGCGPEELNRKYHTFCPGHIGLSGIRFPEPALFEPYYADIPEGAWINCWGVLEIPCDTYHFTRYVSPGRNMDTLEEIKRLPIADFSSAGDSGMKEAVSRFHREGRAAVCWVGHMYEEAWQIRGYTQFLTDMTEHPEICDFLLDRILANNLVAGRAAARAGADMLKIGDDVANQRSMMFSPGMWRRFMKPRWSYFIAEVKKIKPDIRIWYHSDGNIKDIIPELIEIGVDVLNPVQPECLDVDEIISEFGRDLVPDGCIGTQSLMPFGTPEEIKKEVRRLRRLCPDGALILSPTHVLEPDVPMENIRAFLEACNE
ncbi:MAG: hypothetical protein J5758_05725 [Abditibacteriota bacterium]|nr:hypothetical protein [Abditibacteriota bacterium]